MIDIEKPKAITTNSALISSRNISKGSAHNAQAYRNLLILFCLNLKSLRSMDLLIFRLSRFCHFFSFLIVLPYRISAPAWSQGRRRSRKLLFSLILRRAAFERDLGGFFCSQTRRGPNCLKPLFRIIPNSFPNLPVHFSNVPSQ